MMPWFRHMYCRVKQSGYITKFWEELFWNHIEFSKHLSGMLTANLIHSDDYETCERIKNPSSDGKSRFTTWSGRPTAAPSVRRRGGVMRACRATVIDRSLGRSRASNFYVTGFTIWQQDCRRVTWNYRSRVSTTFRI
jgi:hypothetical protein